MSTFKEIVHEVGEELRRMNELGKSEIANGLFNGHGFVLYGPNQPTPETERGIEPPALPAIESPEQSQGHNM